VLDVATHDEAECTAAGKSRKCPRHQVILWATIASVSSGKQTRTHYNVKGPSARSYNPGIRIAQARDAHCRRPCRTTLRHAGTRHTRIDPRDSCTEIDQDRDRRVLEVGPGRIPGHAVGDWKDTLDIGTDVVQAFCLYQSHVCPRSPENVRGACSGSGRRPHGCATSGDPYPAWKWITLTPQEVKLYAGVMTRNHMLGEMHPSSLASLAVLGHGILSHHPGGVQFGFKNWGGRKFEECAC